jgi:nucleotide-binding universal stress UspA family protein
MSEMKMRGILAAVDLGPQSEDLLAWAGWFARLFRANVEVVHALSIGLLPYFTQAQTETLAALLRKECGIVGERIKQLASKASRDVSFTVNVVDGPALQVIRAVVQEDKPDLLVIGSHGHGRLQRMLPDLWPKTCFGRRTVRPSSSNPSCQKPARAACCVL